MKIAIVLCLALASLAHAGDSQCWRRLVDWDLVPGLMVDGPGQDNRPNTFFFGNFGDDQQQCEDACEAEPDCYSYTLPFPDGAWIDMGEDPAWQGLCMGRSISPNVSVRFPDINAGVRIPCVTLPTGDVTITVNGNGIEATSDGAQVSGSPTTFTVSSPGNTGDANTYSFQAADGSFLSARPELVSLEASGADDFDIYTTFYAWPAGSDDGSVALEVFEEYDRFVYVDGTDAVVLGAQANAGEERTNFNVS